MNINEHIETFLRELDTTITINGQRLTSQELAAAYNRGNKIWTVCGNIRKTMDIGLLSYNIYLWHADGWNPKWLLPVATTGLICLRKTELYTQATRWTLGWISGWNRRKTIRTGLLQGRNECLFEIMSAVSTIIGLSWRFSSLTWLMCMPAAITRGLYYGVGLYGINIILRADVQQRLINFLTEVLSELDRNVNDLMVNITGGHNTAKPFEDLVELRTYPDTEQKQCSICLQDDCQQMAQIKECRHEFCQECLRAWYHNPVRIFNCPLCRINLDTPIDNVPVIRNLLTQLFAQ
jgi:hypothetical protein